MEGSPAADFDITDELVGALLREQHPDLARLPREFVEAGWDNVMVRLGNSLCARLPRRAVAAEIIQHEQIWLPRLAGTLPLPIPVPEHIGVAGCGYPWRWSVVPWLMGTAADLSPLLAIEAVRWGDFLRALHVAAPADAPLNPFRGVPLSQRAARIEERMRRLERGTTLITSGLRTLWELARDAPIDVDPTWIHGDLHPRNVLSDQGVISGVIDWGDIAVGDRATDLASVWMLFPDASVRERALSACGEITPATRLRAVGWAIGFGVTLLETGLVDNPRFAAIGAQTLRQIRTEKAGFPG